MTREEAFASCPPGSYVEQYHGQWLVIPFTPVVRRAEPPEASDADW